MCASERLTALFEKSGKVFWSCDECGLVFVHDIYPEYEEDFDGGVYLDHVAGRTELRPKEVRTHAEILARFEPLRSTNRLLEVGCGHGFFLDQARRAGWDVQGVDVVPEMVQLARERFGIDVFEGELPAARFAPASFDAVYLCEVIEHIPDPIELMAEIHRLLRPGGRALLRTGNACSWSARLRGAAWPYYGFGPHGHIRFFGPSSARACARAAGFDDVHVETRGFAFREGAELKGSLAKPLIKLAQAPISTLATRLGRGQRLWMTFVR